jgi:PAS domain S-box-containing protein
MDNTSEFLKQIIDSVADPIFVKDRKHGWVLVNQAFCSFMGHPEDQLIGKSDYDFFPQKEADVFWEKDEEVFKAGRENVNEEFFTDGQGVRRTIITKKTRYMAPGGEFFIVGIIRDMTEIKRTTHELESAYEKLVALQGRLVQSEKMASLGQLAAGIAHEINNPAAYIIANLDIFQEYQVRFEDFIKKLPPELLEARKDASQDAVKLFEALEDLPSLIHETAQGAHRIKKIVEDLRIFAHPAGGGLEYGDLHACIDRAVDIMAGELRYKVKLVKEYGKLPPMRFREQQMLQVFMNLLSNAAQAIPATGTITIKTSIHGKEVYVEVGDNGQGIPPEHLTKIFDPFFTTKPVGQGTGLGLAVVHGIITKHEGTIRATSEVGEGTVFHITLLRDGPGGAGVEKKQASRA